MLHLVETAAVVTAPFYAKDSESLVTALEALLQLPVGKVFLVYDRKSPGRRHAKTALRRMQTAYGSQDRQLTLVEVDTYDTAPRWRLGIVRAFEDEVVKVAFVFPGDIKGVPTAENCAGWAQMLQEAASDTLVLGDYESPEDSFKERFDRLIGHSTVTLLFPRFAREVEQLNHRKLRTEFFVVGRNAYEQFDREMVFFWGTDPTVQLTLSTLSHVSLAVKPPIDLGTIADDPSHRRPLGQLHQIVRFVSQLAVDRMIHEMVAAGNDVDEHLRRYVAMRDILKEIFGRALDTIDDNLEAVRREIEEDANS